MLLTSCADNVCRIWSETVKYKPSHPKTDEKKESTEKETVTSNLLGTDKTKRQFLDHTKVKIYQQYHLVSMFHFHLAAVINPTTDIALMSMIPTSIFGRSFQLQWLNNKEVQLTTAVEAIFASLKSAELSNNLSCGGTKDNKDHFLMVSDDIVDVINLKAAIEESENADEGILIFVMP